MKLRELHGKIEKLVDGEASANIDAYTLAHLTEAKVRISKALDAQYIYNVDSISGGGGPTVIRFGQEPSKN